VRAVLDPNVLISAVLSRSGAPAQVLEAWAQGEFELAISPALIAELERALAYPKLRELISESEAEEFVGWLRAAAELVDDPGAEPAIRSDDPGDDYLIALAAELQVPLVSGDRHLLDLADRLPVFTPRRFLELLQRSTGAPD